MRNLSRTDSVSSSNFLLYYVVSSHGGGGNETRENNRSVRKYMWGKVLPASWYHKGIVTEYCCPSRTGAHDMVHGGLPEQAVVFKLGYLINSRGLLRKKWSLQVCTKLGLSKTRQSDHLIRNNGKFNFPYLGDHKQVWQPYPVDARSANIGDQTSQQTFWKNQHHRKILVRVFQAWLNQTRNGEDTTYGFRSLW